VSIQIPEIIIIESLKAWNLLKVLRVVKMEMVGCVVVFWGGKGLKMLWFPWLCIPNLHFALSEKCCYIHFFFAS